MKKFRLFVTACALMVASGIWAQTDVTSTYLTNADFSQDSPIDNHLCGYGKDMGTHGTSYYGQQAVTGWIADPVGENADGYDNNGAAGAVFEYGSDYEMKGNSKCAPEAGPNGEEGNCLGFFAVWGCKVQYYQDVILLPGKYIITIPIFNASGTQANSSLIGFIADNGTSYTIACNPAAGEWTTGTVEFTLAEETAGKISLGYKSNGSGSGSNPMLFVDGIKIEYIEKVVFEKLEAMLTVANAYKDVLNNSALYSAISSAEAVYGNSSSTQDAINAQETALKDAILSAVGSLSDANGGDVTSIILNNGFENCEAFYDNAAAGADAAGIDYTDQGWKLVAFSAWSNSAVLEYGSGAQINGTVIPESDKNGGSGKGLAVSVGWSGNNYYQSTYPIWLPAGRYTLSAEVYNTFVDATQFNSKLAFVTTEGKAYTSTKNAYTFGTWETDEVVFNLTEPTEGRFQVGGGAVSGGSGSNAKVLFDNLTLNYLDPISGIKANYQEAKEAAEAVLNDETYANVTGDERSALQSEINSSEPYSVEGYNEAIDALNSAKSTFTAAAASYNALAAANAYNVELPYALESKRPANAEASTAEAASEAATQLLTELRAYYESNAIAENIATASDCSSYIINGNNPENIEEWTVEDIEGECNLRIMNNEPYTDADGTAEHSYFDTNSWGKAFVSKVYQDVTLENGTYLLTVKARGNGATSYKLFAGEDTADITTSGNTGGVFGRGWNDFFVVFDATGESVTIGMQLETGNSSNWLSWGNFRLIRLSDNASTGISSIERDNTANGEVFNLQGQRVAKAVKGLYIAKGKKMIVK